MITRNKCKRGKCIKHWWNCTLNKKGVCMARAYEYSNAMRGINELADTTRKSVNELRMEMDEILTLLEP